MAEIYTAFSSEVKVNEETIEGLQTIEYHQENGRKHIGAIGSDERIAVYFGMKVVSGQLGVVSANPTLDQLLQSREAFSIIASLKHNDTLRTVSFDDCFMEDKKFELGLEGHGQTVYSFTATRVREE